MGLTELLRRFPDQKACIEHLEEVLWKGVPRCPHCASISVGRKKENKLVGRWNCYDCKSSFNVLSNTLFEGDTEALDRLNDLLEDVLIHTRVAIFGYEDLDKFADSDNVLPGLAFLFYILEKEVDVPDHGYGHGNKDIRGNRI